MANRDDGAERTAVLCGKRLDVKEGRGWKWSACCGSSTAVVGRVSVPAWVELRVEE